MKFAVICSLWLATVLAQEGIPTRAQSCIDEAARTHTDCESSDLVCLCSHWEKVREEAKDCIVGACGKKRAAKEVLPAAERLCEQVGKDNAGPQSYEEPPHHEPKDHEPNHPAPPPQKSDHPRPPPQKPDHPPPPEKQEHPHQKPPQGPPPPAIHPPTVIDSLKPIIPPTPTLPCPTPYVSPSTSCLTTTSCPASSPMVPVGAVTTVAPGYTSTAGYVLPTAVATAGAAGGFVPAGGLAMMALGALAL